MKKLVYVLILFLCSCSKELSYLGPQIANTTSVNSFGNMINNTMINSADFIESHYAGKWLFGVSGLLITPNTTGTNGYDNFAMYKGWHTNLEDASIEVTFTPSGDSAGIGIGVVGFISGDISTYIARIVLTGKSKGQLRYDVVSGPSPTVKNLANSGATVFKITHGKQYTLTLKRSPDTITVIISDGSKGQSLKLPVGYSLRNFWGQKQGQPAIFWYGGEVLVSKLRYYSSLNKNPTMLFVGDSNMQGEQAGADYLRYTKKVAAYFQGSYIVDAGSANTSRDIVDILPEIIYINPKSVFINIGTNGITQADIDTIKNVLIGNGIKVYLTTIFPNGFTGAVSDNSIIRGESGVTLVDFDANLLNGGSVLYSGYTNDPAKTHLNTAGNLAVYSQLILELSNYLKPK